MKKHYFILLSHLVLLASCNFSETDSQGKYPDTIGSKINATNTLKDTKRAEVSTGYSKIIKIDYQNNKEILDILALLPDSAMTNWEWKKEERKEMVRSVAGSNQFVDATENYNTIRKLTPNYFETSVVDGLWCLSIYKVSKDHYIAITNDIAGDGNEIKGFEIEDQQVNAINVKDLIGKNTENFLINNGNKECQSVSSEETMGMFTYDFSHRNLVSISCYAAKKADSTCFKGNELTLKFNANSKRFEFNKMVWRGSQNPHPAPTI